jgi:hypothetical protein
MRRSGLYLLMTLAASMLQLSAANAQSSSRGWTARLAIRSGIVEVQRGSAWLPIASGDVLVAGEHVRTGTGSTAAVEMSPGRVVTLNELSQIRLGNSGAATVQLEAGSMKVFATADILVMAKDTVLESASPVDLELGYEADRVNLTIFNGAVRNGGVTIRGGNQDPSMRTYNANGRPTQRHVVEVPNPTIYVYPYFMYGYGGRDPNAGAIVPPVVNNPTNPGYRPTQVVPPMSDPIRVPVRKQ